MRILIATVQVPFVFGGAEIHAQNLKNAFIEYGHEAEIISIPFKWYPPDRIPEHILACRLLDIEESCGTPIDLVVGLKFPAYYMKHSNKVLWVLHQHRTAYDLWDTDYCDLKHFPNGTQIRDVIVNSDNKFLREAKKIFANSRNVSNRLKRFNDINAKPLYHPPQDADKFYCSDFENYIFYPSRLTDIKRQHLAISAMCYVNSDVKLLIAGMPDNVEYEKRLKRLIKENNLKNKVKLLGGISQKEKLDLYANALGVVFVPVDEDYGYITLEGFLARKPVLTIADSGGPLEFVEDNVTGYVAEPSPQFLGEAIDNLFANKTKVSYVGKGFTLGKK
jgi:glycosyltransferase involved in cell wall biosynthesis